MESRDEFKVNENIEISAEKGDSFYKTIVMEINSRSLMIGMPMFRNNILLLYEKDWVVIKKTKKDAVYYYSSRVVRRHRENQVSLYEIQYPQLYERVQRRKFLRLPCMLEVHYRPVNEGEVTPKAKIEGAVDKQLREETELLPVSEQSPGNGDVKAQAPGGEFHVSQSIDISGGGVKFYTGYDFSPGQLLEVEIILPDYTVRTHARVVHTGGINHLLNGLGCGKWAAVEFYHLQERERDILVAFIFKKMRERL